MKGKFITVEGIDGAGKTTVVDYICHVLRSEGIEFIRTREMGGTPTAEQVREVILGAPTPLDHITEMLLCFAARVDHTNKVIKPALDRGVWVVCDRYTDSTTAYQGFGGAEGIAVEVNWLDRFALNNFTPDKTLLLDLPAATALSRLEGSKDAIESRGVEYFEKVRKGFLAIHRGAVDRMQVIDASQDEDKVIQDVVAIIHKYVKSVTD
jgi:dTMP kinase